MVYKLHTTKETRFFDDFMALISYIENNYEQSYKEPNPNNPLFTDLRYSSNDEKFGYYTVVL